MSLAKNTPATGRPVRYDEDFAAWAFEQAEILRTGRLADADLENLVEEIESLGNGQLHALESYYALLIFHLLKWQFQPERRSRSWSGTILNARAQLRRREKRNPGLKARAGEIVADIYPDSRRQAAIETGLPIETFPDTCPYSLDQLRDPDFLPE
ncbi:DUF29 domain-containing protein [Jiella avicenniae]|uniref:DUF29 domain-containing protein n=1 Tax=Jiella avicenniae TaxID=2907202 RepID=A0A9X1TA20_9HYPH|nr:DUF29 domain-containing protein [Jiella avicenniae]MCE7026788.1 DUF29 domain-containing protein [Jiella avicenniae]